MSNRQRLIEINAELKQLNQRRRDLLEERRQLTGTRTRDSLSAIWVDPIFEIIKGQPGITRREILVKLGSPHMTFSDMSNCLTVLRRRGNIENRGTRKDSRWYVKELNAPKSVSPDPLDEVFRRSKERVARLGL